MRRFKNLLFIIKIKKMSSNRDLRKFQSDDAIVDAFSKLVSGGRSGYKTIIEKTKPTPKCSACNTMLTGDEKFCPKCGNKLK